jgi:hypothetical protein
MSDVFISYSSEDRPFAGRLASALEASNLTVWWDKELIGGKDWETEIRKAIAASHCVIVLWSNRSVTSPYVKTRRPEAATVTSSSQ